MDEVPACPVRDFVPLLVRREVNDWLSTTG
jgi:hypothetical protein